MKYADTNDWIEIPAYDLDSFVDMIEKTQGKRQSLTTIGLKVCALARTPKQTVQERLRSSPSPTYERTSGNVHVAKNQMEKGLEMDMFTRHLLRCV